MGITFEKGLLIAGYRPTIFKEGLTSYFRTRSPGNMVDLKTVFDTRRDGAIVYEECLDRGLIADDDDGEITEAGLSIIRGKGRPKAPLEKAQAVLDGFLSNIAKLNADPKQVIYIDQAWLYGSVMNRADTVGDIDVALVKSRRPEWDKKWDEMRKHVRQVAKQRKLSIPTSGIRSLFIEDVISNCALYGARRHPLLAGVQTDIDDLISLGVPCQLIYDRLQGGSVSQPIVSRHPESNGRENDQPAPSVIPDLSPAIPLRPMDGRWLCEYDDCGIVRPYRIFRAWDDDAHALFPLYPKDLRVIAEGSKPWDYTWLPKRLKGGDIDGRNRVIIANRDGALYFSFVLHRDIELGSTEWTLHVRFSDYELSRRRKYVDLIKSCELNHAAALIIATDAERMIRRAAEQSSPCDTVVAIHMSANSEINEDIIDGVYRALCTGRTRLVPLGGSQTVRIDLIKGGDD